MINQESVLLADLLSLVRDGILDEDMLIAAVNKCQLVIGGFLPPKVSPHTACDSAAHAL